MKSPKERESVRVCVWRESECVRVCVCVRERERESGWICVCEPVDIDILKIPSQ